MKLSFSIIAKQNPCQSGFNKLLKSFGKELVCSPVPSWGHDETEFPASIVLKTNGVGDAVWACRCFRDREELWRGFNIWMFEYVSDCAYVEFANCICAARAVCNGTMTYNGAREHWDAMFKLRYSDDYPKCEIESSMDEFDFKRFVADDLAMQLLLPDQDIRALLFYSRILGIVQDKRGFEADVGNKLRQIFEENV